MKKQKANQLSSKGIFEKALRGETFGPNPGYVDVRIAVSVYVAQLKREVNLPGKQIDLLVSSIDEIDQLVAVIQRAIELWSAGGWNPSVGRFINEQQEGEL